MGVTSGELGEGEEQVITITVPDSLTRDQADALSAALNDAVEEFNDAHPAGEPSLTVEN
jgi:hypothetical protein